MDALGREHDERNRFIVVHKVKNRKCCRVMNVLYHDFNGFLSILLDCFCSSSVSVQLHLELL